MPGLFYHIKTDKFLIHPEESDEQINEGMFGRALADYLQIKLRERGYIVSDYSVEDWGYLLEITASPFRTDLGIYSGKLNSATRSPCHWAVSLPNFGKAVWSWRKLRYLDRTEFYQQLDTALTEVFRADLEIRLIEKSKVMSDLWSEQ